MWLHVVQDFYTKKYADSFGELFKLKVLPGSNSHYSSLSCFHPEPFLGTLSLSSVSSTTEQLSPETLKYHLFHLNPIHGVLVVTPF